MLREGPDRLAAAGDASRRLTGRARGTASRRLVDWRLVVPPVVTLVVGLWGVTANPYWADEADTVSAVSRSLPQQARLLRHVDAVHGLYYLLLWPVARVLGTGELATRLPSVLAMAGAAFGVAVIGRRLRSPRAGLCAGLVFAALPMVTQAAHDARPYALVTAAAVLASLLLIRAADDPRPARFVGYALSLVLLGYLEVFALLLVPAHAITLTRLSGQRTLPGPGRSGTRKHFWASPRGYLDRRWLAAVAAVGVAVTPVLIGAWLQRSTIGWLRRPGRFELGYLPTWLATGTAVGAVVLALLAIVGARRGDSPGQAEAARELTWLALPWLALPPLALVAVSEIKPVYTFRYVVFCLPAVALLAGAGLAALGLALRAAALALVVALALPAQLGMRVPGSGIGAAVGAATQVLASQRRPGDAVVYPGGGIPPWYLAYPRAFGPLRDISLAQPGAAIGRLYGSSVSMPTLKRRERGVRRIWVVEMAPPWRNLAPYIAPGFRLARTWLLRLARTWLPGHGQARLALYERSS